MGDDNNPRRAGLHARGMRVKLWHVPGGSRSALRGFALGAGVGLCAHLANLAGTTTSAHDDASRRVTVELIRLGHETSLFVIALSVAVALAAGVVGAAVALVWHFAAWKKSWLAVPAALALLLLRAFLRQPALLEPSLGGAQGTLAPMLQRAATWLSPWMIDLLIGAVILVALRRRWKALAASVTIVSLLMLVPRLFQGKRGAKLLILAVDSLRPDKLENAPRLIELQKKGVSFDLALSPMASTTPAWISLLTGRYPHAHGVRHMFPRRELRADWLDTLPRRLISAGIHTSVVSDYAGDFFPLFQLGFERQKVSPPLTLGLVFQREVMTHSALALALLNQPLGQRLFPVLRFLMTNADPERIADGVLSELDGNNAVVAFFSTTHIPFAAPWPWYRKFASPAYGGTHRYLYDVQKLGDVTNDVRLPEKDVEQVRRLYDGSVAAVDHAIGRILDRLDDQTVVVLLADHGENLFEPGNTTFHGKWFRGGDEANRVPLVIVGPNLSPRRVPEPVSLVDVAPTLLDLLQLPSGGFDGVSLLPAFSTGHAPEHDVFAETAVWLAGPPEPDGVKYPALPQLLEADPHDGFQLVLKTRYEDIEVEAKQRMLRHGSSKLLYIPTADGVRWELYDMANDPRQEKSLAATPTLQRTMRKFLLRDPERELDAREHLVRRTED
jgi:arylsulfatase A-like enzyme